MAQRQIKPGAIEITSNPKSVFCIFYNGWIAHIKPNRPDFYETGSYITKISVVDRTGLISEPFNE